MSGKINILGVVIAHCRTFRDHGQDRVSWLDFSLFFLCPTIIAIILFLSGAALTTNLASSLINASAILTGLLLNLLILMFDQKSKVLAQIDNIKGASDISPKSAPDYTGKRAQLELRSKLISETVSNISFTTLLCIASLCSLLLFSAFDVTTDVQLFERFTYALNTFIWTNVVLTILMVMKRVFALFSSSS